MPQILADGPCFDSARLIRLRGEGRLFSCKGASIYAITLPPTPDRRTYESVRLRYYETDNRIRGQLLLSWDIRCLPRHDGLLDAALSTCAGYSSDQDHTPGDRRLRRSSYRMHRNYDTARKFEGKQRMTGSVETKGVAAPTGVADRKLEWLKWAFRIQSALLVLVVLMMGYVSWRFSAQQRAWAASNLQKEAQIQAQESDLQNAWSSVVTAEFVAAQDVQLAADSSHQTNLYTEAMGLYDNALRYAPTDAIIWRQKALLSIRVNQAQNALDQVAKSGLNFKDGANLLTEAILECAVRQPAKADSLKSQALSLGSRTVTPWPSPQDKEDFRNVCHSSLTN